MHKLITRKKTQRRHKATLVISALQYMNNTLCVACVCIADLNIVCDF